MAVTLRRLFPFIGASVLILSFIVSFSDLGAGQQQTNFPELIQDEDVSHHWCHSHDFWGLLVSLQLLVSGAVMVHGKCWVLCGDTVETTYIILLG